MWSGLHDRKKKWEGWAALDSFAGSNLSLRGVFGGCMLSYRLHLLCDKNAAISLCSMRNVGWVERPCPEVTLELRTPDSLWGTLGPVAMGMVTTGTWRVVALVGKSRAALGRGGQGDMGTWVSSRDS